MATNFLNQSSRLANATAHLSVIDVNWETSTRDSKDRSVVKELKKTKKQFHQGRGRKDETIKYKAKYLKPESKKEKKTLLTRLNYLSTFGYVRRNPQLAMNNTCRQNEFYVGKFSVQFDSRLLMSSRTD